MTEKISYFRKRLLVKLEKVEKRLITDQFMPREHRQWKAKVLLPGIREAIGRIDNKTYGKCLECEDEIPIERLQWLPDAKRCVECQEFKERKRRRA